MFAVAVTGAGGHPHVRHCVAPSLREAKAKAEGMAGDMFGLVRLPPDAWRQDSR